MMQQAQNLVESQEPIQHSQRVINMGTSVVAIKYRDGVMMAADTAISVGSIRRVKDARRIVKLTDDTIIGACGEMSDYQVLCEKLQ